MLIKPLLVFFAFIYSFISIVKHNHFQTGLDFGIYVQTFWSYINFKLPMVTLYPTYGDLVFTDHFTPTLVLLAPFYFFWNDPKLLLIAQSVFFVAGAYPIYHFAKEQLKNEFLSLSIAVSYLLFFGTQFALTFDFHSATYSAAFLPWILWTMFRKRWKLFFLFYILAIGAKEDMSLLLASLGFYMIISNINIKIGVIVLLFSLSYFFAVTQLIMPYLSVLSAKTFNTPRLPVGLDGWLIFLFNSPIKIKTILLSLASFSFLPLFSGLFLILPLSHFIINFISPDFMGRWDIYLHYRVHLASILSFATLMVIKKLNLRNQHKTIVGCMLLFSIISFDYYLHLPLNTLFKKNFYQHEQWMEDNYEVMKKIPSNAYLLTQNNLAPHVGNRQYLYYFPQHLDKADYIFLDFHPNQPIINFWLSDSQAEVEKRINELIVSKSYSIFYQKNNSLLLKRNK